MTTNLRFDQQCTLYNGGLILSKVQAKSFVVPTNFKKAILIRITGVDEEFDGLQYPEQYSNILKVKFDDCSSLEHGSVITNEQGMQILSFLLNNPHDLFVVHCNAGMSRSAGVMLGWAKATENSVLEQLIRNTTFYKPNYVVVSTIFNQMNKIREESSNG